MVKDFRGQHSNLLVGIGPAIDSANYPVKEDVAFLFSRAKKEIMVKNKLFFLGLKKAAVNKLLDLGIKIKNIEVSPISTFKDLNYFSYRRDRPTNVEAQMAIFGIRHI